MSNFKLILFSGLFLVGSYVWADADPDENTDPQTATAQIMAEACEQALTGEKLEEARSRWSGKTIILDTNVLLNDPFAYIKFPGATVLLPGTVIEEMDAKKTDEKTGRAARQFFRNMSRLMETPSRRHPNVGWHVGEGTMLKFDHNNYVQELKGQSFDMSKKDNEILATAKHYSSENPDKVVLISDDNAVRLKATTMGLMALPFEYDWVAPKKENAAYHTLQVREEEFKRFAEQGLLPKPPDLNIAPNEFVFLQVGDQLPSPDSIARYYFDREDASKTGLRKLVNLQAIGAPFQPRNLEQHMALDVLLDPTIELVVMEAQAGTGKTFVTMMAALLQIPSSRNTGLRKYDDVMITKQLSDVGSGRLGTLPGDADEKVAEDFNSFYDNMRVIWDKIQNRKTPSPKNQPVNISGVQLMVFSKVRGRSLHNSFVVVDEAQNIGIHEAKTILTRAAEGTKMVLLGDASQIDVPYLNERNNGLSVSINLFTNSQLSESERSRVGFVKLTDSVRSELAKMAAKVFANPLPSN